MKPLFLLLFVAMCFASRSAVAQADVGSKHWLLAQIQKRDAKSEFDAKREKGTLCFYLVGSRTYGSSLPGLTQKDADDAATHGVPLVLEFTDDPAPLGFSEQYWEAVQHFASAYNRLVYAYFEKKGWPNQALLPTPTSVTSPAAQEPRQP